MKQAVDFAPKGENTVVHVVDYMCKSQRQARISTFAAELLTAGGAVNHGLLLSQQLHAFLVGPTTTSSVRDQRTQGQCDISLVLYTNAMSVYAAISATFINTIAKTSLLCYVQYLRTMFSSENYQP